VVVGHLVFRGEGQQFPNYIKVKIRIRVIRRLSWHEYCNGLSKKRIMAMTTMTQGLEKRYKPQLFPRNHLQMNAISRRILEEIHFLTPSMVLCLLRMKLWNRIMTIWNVELCALGDWATMRKKSCSITPSK
jgi:hypothetical protein